MIRTALSSQEEQWVIVCYKFFLSHGFCDWYKIDQNKALIFMMKEGKGHVDPVFLSNKIAELYKSVGC
jgi:hypothetical protein